MIVYPNAKINIGLNVLEKQADGYHKISSVFYPVHELFDMLEILPSEDFFSLVQELKFREIVIFVLKLLNSCVQILKLVM